MRTKLILAGLVMSVTGVLAGDLNVVGNVSVASNLTVQSATLGGESRSLWPGVGGVNLATPVVDFSWGEHYCRYTLTNHVTWSLTNHVAGRQVWLELTQDAVGGWTNAWPATVLWPGGHVALGAAGADTLALVRLLDTGVWWLAEPAGVDYPLPCSTNCSYALRFDGQQNSAQVAYDADFYTNAALTVECWFLAPAETENTAQQWPLVGTFHGEAGSYEIALDDRCSRCVTFYLVTEVGFAQIWGATGLADGQWHHAALVWDGSEMRGYVDGELIETVAATGSLTNGVNPVLFGRDLQGDGFYGPVTVDEVRLSRVARWSGASFTPARSWTVDPATIGYWKCDEASGESAADSSGNGRAAALLGDPLPVWSRGK